MSDRLRSHRSPPARAFAQGESAPRRRIAAVLATTIWIATFLAGPAHAADEAIVPGDLRVDATTLTVPQPGARIRHVVPGDAGGSGTSGDPFRGLQAAADTAGPGDTFEILASGAAGSPITFRGPGDGSVVVDGNGTDRRVVTIVHGEWGIDAQNTQDVVISRNEL